MVYKIRINFQNIHFLSIIIIIHGSLVYNSIKSGPNAKKQTLKHSYPLLRLFLLMYDMNNHLRLWYVHVWLCWDI